MKRLGCDVAHYRPLRSDPFLVQQHLLSGHTCQNIFDVGAYRGDVAACYARLFPAANIYSFEPYPPSYELLAHRFQQSPRVHLINSAVSSQSGESTFHVNRDASTNSLLATGEGFATATAVTTQQIKVRTITLDEFIASNRLPPPEILKFDIQGNELEALRGSGNMLSGNGPLLIYTEVLFEPLYENCAQFEDLTQFLGGKGYELYNLYSLHHDPDGRLEFGDALFVHKRLRPRKTGA